MFLVASDILRDVSFRIPKLPPILYLRGSYRVFEFPFISGLGAEGVTTVLAISTLLRSRLISSFISRFRLFNSTRQLYSRMFFFKLPLRASESKHVLFADSFERSLFYSRALNTQSPILLIHDLDRFFFYFYFVLARSSCILFYSLSLAFYASLSVFLCVSSMNLLRSS